MINPTIARLIIPDYNFDYGSILAVATKAQDLESKNLDLFQESIHGA